MLSHLHFFSEIQNNYFRNIKRLFIITIYGHDVQLFYCIAFVFPQSNPPYVTHTKNTIIGDLIWENVCKNCNWFDLDTLPIFVGRDQKRDLWM